MEQTHDESAEEPGSEETQPPQDPALEQPFHIDHAVACTEGLPAAKSQQAEQSLGDAEAGEDSAAPAGAAKEGQRATEAGSPAHDSEPGLLEDGEPPADEDPSQQPMATQIDDVTATAAADSEGHAAAAAAAESVADQEAAAEAAEAEAAEVDAAATAAAVNFAASITALVAAAAVAGAASPRTSPAAPGEKEDGVEEGEIAQSPLAAEPAPDAELGVCDGGESAEAAGHEAAQQSQPGANAADPPAADPAGAAEELPTVGTLDVISRLAEATKVRMGRLRCQPRICAAGCMLWAPPLHAARRPWTGHKPS